MELTGLNDKISRKDAIIKSLTATKSDMETSEGHDRGEGLTISTEHRVVCYENQLSRTV